MRFGFFPHFFFFQFIGAHANSINRHYYFCVTGIAGGNLSMCQSPPPVPAQTRRTVTPDNPDPAEVITEVNIN